MIYYVHGKDTIVGRRYLRSQDSVGVAAIEKIPRSFAERARIILMSAEGNDLTDIVEKLGVTRQTVHKWRKRFIQDGVAGLSDLLDLAAPLNLARKRLRKSCV